MANKGAKYKPPPSNVQTSKQMSVEDMYAELGMNKDSQHTKTLMLGREAARLQELAAEREKQHSDKVTQKKEAAAAAAAADSGEAFAPMRVQRTRPGMLVCGERKELATGVPPVAAAAAAVAPGQVTASRRRTSEEEPKHGAEDHHHDVDEHGHERIPACDGEAGKWRRVTAARYIDVYLNGGKFGPPAESLMEEGACGRGGSCASSVLFSIACAACLVYNLGGCGLCGSRTLYLSVHRCVAMSRASW